MKFNDLIFLFNLDYKVIQQPDRFVNVLPAAKWFENESFFVEAYKSQNTWFFSQYSKSSSIPFNPGNTIEHLIK